MPHGGSEALSTGPEAVAGAASVAVPPPPHEDKSRTVRGTRAGTHALQSLTILIIFVLLGRTSQRRVLGGTRLLLRQPRNAVLNVVPMSCSTLPQRRTRSSLSSRGI